MNFHCYLLCTKISFLGFWYIQSARSQISTPSLTHTVTACTMQERDRSQHSFYLEVKLRLFFIKQTEKFVTKAFILLLAVQVKNTVLCSITIFFLFVLKPSICKSCEETDTWTLKVVGYWIKASSTVTSIMCCQLSLCCMPASHPANGYSNLLAIEQVTFHQHYCQAGFTLVYWWPHCARTRTLQNAVRKLDTCGIFSIKTGRKISPLQGSALFTFSFSFNFLWDSTFDMYYIV